MNPMTQDFQTRYTESFSRHQNLKFRVTATYQPGQKYRTYPDRKYLSRSIWPKLELSYIKGIKALGGDLDYDRIHLTITDDFELGRIGLSKVHISMGEFFE